MGAILTPVDREWLVRSVLSGRYGGKWPAADKIHRVLDVGAGAGEFAVFMTLNFPLCWVDAWEPDPELRKILALNAPPGCRVLEEDLSGEDYWTVKDPSKRARYDVVRYAYDARFTDGDPPFIGKQMTIYDYSEVAP
jgi:hypothetical protein